MSGQLSLCHHLLVPQQEDTHLQGGVLHHHQQAHQEVQELQEEASRQGISKHLQPHSTSRECGVSSLHYSASKWK